MEFGLDIYDRMYGYAGHDQARFLFPKEFRSNIRGKLEYDEMVEAYRTYRTFLNVNSVYDSPTMFSRRVFELMACGTPVVSTRSLGMTRFFGDLVAQVKTERDVREALEHLLNDRENWRRVSARGIRLVMSKHTCEERLKTVCETIGLGVKTESSTPLTAVALPEGDAATFAARLAAQSERPNTVVVAGEGPAAQNHLAALQRAGFSARIVAPARLAEALGAEGRGSNVAFMNSRHYYGPNYLLDARLALGYSKAPVTGLAAHFVARAAGHFDTDESAGEECLMRDEVLGATLAVRADSADRALIDRIFSRKMVRPATPCYARSRFEFLFETQGEPSESTLRRICL